MKSSWLIVTLLLLICVFCGCGGSTNSTTAGTPPTSSPSPRPIASTADVVKVSTDGVSLTAGGNIDAKILVSVSPGFHVNANPPTFSYLIATEVTAGKVEGIIIGTPGYPAAKTKKFQFAEQPLAVYEGEVSIKLNLRADKNSSAGPRTLPIALRVQACDEEQCYPPVTLNSALSVTVK